MKELVLVRGLPCSGKSTIIENNRLEDFAISKDKVRLLLASTITDADKITSIAPINEKTVHSIMLEILEERMKNGIFTIIEGIFEKPSSYADYMKLAKKYGYKVYEYNCNEPLDVLLARREERTDKFIPADVIIKKYLTYPSSLNDSNITNINDFDNKSLYRFDNLGLYEFTRTRCHTLKGYTGVIVVGDIHSCANVLQRFLDNNFREDYLFIFLGDYFDRGLEPVRTWNILKGLYKKPNVVMIMGNHEKHLLNYINDEPITSSIAKKTYDELEKACVSKDELQNFYNNLKEYYMFKIFNKYYLCTHAGTEYFNSKMSLVSNDTLTRNSGNRDMDIDAVYTENAIADKCKYEDKYCDKHDVIQIHGHVKTPTGNTSKYSYNLEESVEFGGRLMFARIKPDKVVIDGYKNKLVERNKKEFSVSNAEMNTLINAPGIHIKELENNLLSVNFSRETFISKYWSDATVKARGLFIDKSSGEIVARSFDKFFNLEEVPETRFENLEKTLKFPVSVKEKLDGSLGIISLVNGLVHFFSKTTDKSMHSEILKRLWNQIPSNIRTSLIRLMYDLNVSIVVEMIDNEDPHVIHYKQECLYLLAFVKNTLQTKYINIESCLDTRKIHLDNKTIKLPKTYHISNDFNDLKNYLENIISKVKFEGVVCTDANNFHFKYKSDFYNEWKIHRETLYRYLDDKEPNRDFEFYRFLKDNNIQTENLHEVQRMYNKYLYMNKN